MTRGVALLTVACLALGAFSLLLPSVPTYDPWAWLHWGGQITELDLNTRGGPSWKPLPVLFTIPAALVGEEIAPYLWVAVARAGALLGCALAYRIASSIVGGGYGIVAGALSTVALLLSFRYLEYAAFGLSEGLLVALMLLALAAYLDSRRRLALYAGVAAALIRPEVGPFLLGYGAFLWRHERQLRRELIAFAALIPLAWLLPEWWGSGDPLRAGQRANDPNPGSAGLAEHPAPELLTRYLEAMLPAVAAGAVLALGFALRDDRGTNGRSATIALWCGGLAWFGIIAAMTEAGFSGAPRYLMPTTAAAAVLAGVGLARLMRLLAGDAGVLLGRGWAGHLVAGVAAAALLLTTSSSISSSIRRLESGLERLDYQADQWRDLKSLVERVGRRRLAACGRIFTGPYETQVVAYELRLDPPDVGLLPGVPPGALLRSRTLPNGPLPRLPANGPFRSVIAEGAWELFTAPRQGADPEARRCPTLPDAPVTRR